MSSIATIRFGNGTFLPKGVVNLFQNSYVRTCKSWSYYRKIPRSVKVNLLTKSSEDLLSNKQFAWVCDKEDKNVIYSLICYEIIDKKLIVYFAFTKYDFRGYGFTGSILKQIEKGTNEWTYRVPKILKKYPKLWSKYLREPPHYPL